MNERGDAMLQQNLQEAQVEALAEPGSPAYFRVDVTDLVLVTPGLAVVLGFEVAAVLTPAAMPPDVPTVVLERHEDMESLELFLPEA
jgi:hypothetical protein